MFKFCTSEICKAALQSYKKYRKFYKSVPSFENHFENIIYCSELSPDLLELIYCWKSRPLHTINTNCWVWLSSERGMPQKSLDVERIGRSR